MADGSALHEIINNSYSAIFRDPKFRLSVEAHRNFFLSEGNYEVVAVDDHLAYKYRHDLQGYLTATNVAHKLHLAVMRINNMTSPMDFSYPKYKYLFIPSERAMQEVIDRFKTQVGGNI